MNVRGRLWLARQRLNILLGDCQWTLRHVNDAGLLSDLYHLWRRNGRSWRWPGSPYLLNNLLLNDLRLLLSDSLLVQQCLLLLLVSELLSTSSLFSLLISLLLLKL